MELKEGPGNLVKRLSQFVVPFETNRRRCVSARETKENVMLKAAFVMGKAKTGMIVDCWAIRLTKIWKVQESMDCLVSSQVSDIKYIWAQYIRCMMEQSLYRGDRIIIGYLPICLRCHLFNMGISKDLGHQAPGYWSEWQSAGSALLTQSSASEGDEQVSMLLGEPVICAIL